MGDLLIVVIGIIWIVGFLLVNVPYIAVPVIVLLLVWFIRRTIKKAKAVKKEKIEIDRRKNECDEVDSAVENFEYKECHFYHIYELDLNKELNKYLKVCDKNICKVLLEAKEQNELRIKASDKFAFLTEIQNINQLIIEHINYVLSWNFNEMLLITPGYTDDFTIEVRKGYDIGAISPGCGDVAGKIKRGILIKNFQEMKSDLRNLLVNNIKSFKENENEFLIELKSTILGKRGEESVSDEVHKYMDKYQILEGIRLKNLNQNINQKSAESDFILVGKNGIFCVEVKNYGEDSDYELIVEKDGRWLKRYSNGKEIIIESAEVQNQVHIDCIKETLTEELKKDYNVYGIIVIVPNRWRDG